MEGKIDHEGTLIIYRSMQRTIMQCPYGPDVYPLRTCGDWCPLFSEPHEQGGGPVWLYLCNATLRFEKFTDERKEQSP